jgi:hypothetical protein
MCRLCCVVGIFFVILGFLSTLFVLPPRYKNVLSVVIFQISRATRRATSRANGFPRKDTEKADAAVD